MNTPDPMFESFRAYESRPITRMALQIDDDARVTEIGTNEYSYQGIRFKAYQTPVTGDFICRLTMDDTYHVARAVMEERNFVGDAGDMDFGTALIALKRGARVQRAGWNGKNMFAYLVPANSYPAQTDAAKAFFGDGSMVPYNAYFALKTADGTVSTWVPSGSDALAEDWSILP